MTQRGLSYKQQMLYQEGRKLHHQDGRLDEAILCYRRVLKLQPYDYLTLFNLALALSAQGQHQEAEAALRRSLTIKPNSVEAIGNLGTALAMQSRYDEAIAQYKKVLLKLPLDMSTLNNIAAAQLLIQDLPAAADTVRRVLQLDPRNSIANEHLGSLMVQHGQYKEALEQFSIAIECDPQRGEGYMNLAEALHAEGHITAAIQCHTRALTLIHYPKNLLLHFARAHNYLLLGRFEEAWQDIKIAQPLLSTIPGFLKTKQPIWDGSPLSGKRILLHSSEGLGDAIQMLRYVPLMQRLDCEIVLRVQPPLVRLAQRFTNCRVITESEPPFTFDVHCPLTNLPVVFKTTLGTIPNESPYLSIPEPELTNGTFLSSATQLRVGLVWAGNIGHRNNDTRSIHLSMFKPLLSLKDVKFYSLQVGPQHQELSHHLEEYPELIDLRPDPTNMADTAAKIIQLDIILTVDTSTAHLAAALGIPTWIMLSFVPDWRWLLGRHDSPWYPTARLFRQQTRGDWSAVINTVREALLLKSSLRGTHAQSYA